MSTERQENTIISARKRYLAANFSSGLLFTLAKALNSLTVRHGRGMYKQHQQQAGLAH